MFIAANLFQRRGGGIESERDYTGEQFFWGDEIYNGFAYEFVGDICVSERLFEYGWVIAEVTYYSGGQLRSLETGGDIIQNMSGMRAAI